MLIIETLGGALMALSAIMFIFLGTFSRPRRAANEIEAAPQDSSALVTPQDLARLAKLMARKSAERDIAA